MTLAYVDNATGLLVNVSTDNPLPTTGGGGGGGGDGAITGPLGSGAAAVSVGVALSTEDRALIDGLETNTAALKINIVEPSDSTFTRPSDTTGYSIGDLVANSTTAGSVTRLQFTGATKTGSGGSGRILRTLGIKSGSVSCTLRYHWLKTNHAVTNGDNGALVLTSLDPDNYIGYHDVVFVGSALTAIGSSAAEVSQSDAQPLDYVLASGDTLYCLVQAVTAFTPANGGTIGCRPILQVLS